jgi:hypothetical protein
LKNPLQKRAGGMAQGVGPELKPLYRKQTNKQINKYKLKQNIQHKQGLVGWLK